MPFATNAALVNTDLNNMLRGLFRDNVDRALTGTTIETDASSTTLTGGTITATGGLFVFAAGTASGAGGSKTIRLYLGTTVLFSFTVAAGAQEWRLEAWLANTTQSAQRYSARAEVVASGGGAPTLTTRGYNTAAVDTSVNATLKVTQQLVAGADTSTQSMMDVYVVQIT